MAHHSEDQHFSEGEINKFLDSGGFKMPRLKNDIGATGKFPNGKIADNDLGEIAISIREFNGRIEMSFGDKPIGSIGFTAEQAQNIAMALMKHASRITGRPFTLEF